MPTLKSVTLGCKVNQYESEYAREGFRRLGYREAAGGEPADLILVNTCAVTAESEAKSRKIVRRLANRNPLAEIIVMGCYAARAPNEAAALPGVSEVIQHKSELPDLLARRGLKAIPDGISTFEGRHRAWVKIQDGCTQRCSYCIIPLVRPVMSSRPAGHVLDEISRLVKAGFAEFVLSGIHLGHYGTDIILPFPFGRVAGGEGHVADATAGSPSGALSAVEQAERNALKDRGNRVLVDLLRRIIAIKGEFRVRLSSIEAAEVTPALLDLMANRPQRICPHLHIPMQSGSNRILKRMGRPWPIGKFIDRCLEIRHRLDDPGLTTDAIVGFPGETEADFAATCRAAQEIGFSKIHVFRFSPRQGTEAATFPNRVPQRVHRAWAAELTQISNRLAGDFMKKLRGKTLQVLVEGVRSQSPGMLVGTADRYVAVELAGPPSLVGRLVNVQAGDVINGCLQAQGLPQFSCQREWDSSSLTQPMVPENTASPY